MSGLTPLEPLFDASRGRDLPLPAALADLYGGLRFPAHPHRPHVVGNFVATLDGVVSLGIPGKASGRAISGDNPHDRLVMGLLRAAADAVIVGAGTFRASSKRRWTAEAAYPALAGAYGAFRIALRKPAPPLNVLVTGSGDVDLARPPGDPGAVPLLVVTTDAGARRLLARRLPPDVEVVQVETPLTAARVLERVVQARPGDLILVEAGPRLLGDFLAEGCLDELFLTIAPQIAGRDGAGERPGFVAGQRFAPDDPRWATLVGLKRAESHLLARYALKARCGSDAERVPTPVEGLARRRTLSRD
jgi:riboflavin biosynthesis pyrimidine reductase